MAETTDLAPDRPAATPRSTPRRRTSANGSRRPARTTEQQLEEQISQLQDDVRSIASSLARLGSEKVTEVRRAAKNEYRNLVSQGQNVAEDVGDEFEAVERQIKDTIRARPITAVLSAVGIGFLVAALTR